MKPGEEGNWEQVAKLIADDGAADDSFGYSVSISGDTAIVGARVDGDAGFATGSAYIFGRDQGGEGNWGQVAKLLASDAEGFSLFGTSVSINSDTVVVGSIWDDDAGTNSGSAYVFERDHGGEGNWGQVAKLTADDAASEDFFGISVSVSGDMTIIGASGNDDEGDRSGSAYIFERDHGGEGSWGQVAKLTADDAAALSLSGHSVSASDDIVAISARRDNETATGSGAAYIFKRDLGTGMWEQTAKLIPDDATANDAFGYSVSVSGNTSIIGAYVSRSAYVFERRQGSWEQVAKLTGSGTYFGFTVSVSGNTSIVGAPLDDEAGPTQSGSVTIFQATSSLLYGVDDINKIDSQIFTVDLDSGTVSNLGPLHIGEDFETLTLDPATGALYTISFQSGLMYEVNTSSGALTLVGDTGVGFNRAVEIVGSAFHPITGTLWVYRKGYGLRKPEKLVKPFSSWASVTRDLKEKHESAEAHKESSHPLLAYRSLFSSAQEKFADCLPAPIFDLSAAKTLAHKVMQGGVARKRGRPRSRSHKQKPCIAETKPALSGDHLPFPKTVDIPVPTSTRLNPADFDYTSNRGKPCEGIRHLEINCEN